MTIADVLAGKESIKVEIGMNIKQAATLMASLFVAILLAGIIIKKS